MSTYTISRSCYDWSSHAYAERKNLTIATCNVPHKTLQHKPKLCRVELPYPCVPDIFGWQPTEPSYRVQDSDHVLNPLRLAKFEQWYGVVATNHSYMRAKSRFMIHSSREGDDLGETREIGCVKNLVPI